MTTAAAAAHYVAGEAVSSSWPMLTRPRRSRRLLAFCDALTARLDDLVAAEVGDTGKVEDRARAEVETAIDTIRFYAGAVRTQETPAAGSYVDSTTSEVRLEPLGRVLVILPFNYPMLLAGWRLGPILAAGCVAVVKPDPRTPSSVRLLAAIAADVLGEGIVTLVTGGDDVGRALLEYDWDAVAFTGSPSAGAYVAANAGFARVSLELGGNNVAIVHEDALPWRARDLVDAVLYNAGQSCAAPGRIILVGNAAAFLERLKAHVAESHAETFGRLIDVDAARRYGARLGRYPKAVVGWETDHEASVPASLIVDPEPSEWDEEVFGPMLLVRRVESVGAALEEAGRTRYGLAASVWTEDVFLAQQAASMLRVGEVWVNCHLAQSPELPHGGYGLSGSGTDMSAATIRDYQRTKTVTWSLP